jgi:hypothetical protein
LNKAPVPNADRQPICATGVDPSTVDPRWVLAGIAIDPTQPGNTRVQACRTLLGTSDQQQTREEKTLSLLDQRTLEVLNRRCIR